MLRYLQTMSFVVFALLPAARADEPPPAREAPDEGEPFELPLAPQEIDPVLAAEVHLSGVVPILRAPLCPPEHDCVFAAGGGVGGRIERRWPTGPALGLAYDVWFLDSNNVYELGVMQMLSARLRYLFMQGSLVHPHVDVGVGALIFGDTLQIATVGFAVEAQVGAELELTESLALTVALPFRAFTTGSFQTTRDRVGRAQEPGVNLAVSLQVGLAVLETP